ncbi:hypothetical protein Kisp01_30010 [Kineosporia sp. NBRC 101677]|nr:hypothetical protein Kisp01_30010 [Kineosporia sp. NBRC 101677]
MRPDPRPGGDVSVYDEDGTVVVLLRGVIDISVVGELEEAGRHAVDQQSPILVDVRHVEMIDSVGISFLVRIAASVRSQGGTTELCGPAPVVEEMLAVAGAAPLFQWVEGRVSPGGQETP